MEIQITRHNVNLNDKQIDYLNKKIEKAVRAGGRIDEEVTITKVDIRLLKIKTEENIGIEINIFTKGALIRAVEQALTFEAAVDLAEEKLQKQLRRYKERYKKRRRKNHWIPSSELTENIPSDEPQITNRQRFSNSKPMHEEEAVELMELAGHDFFLFNNMETHRWSVAYKRKNGSYGIIEPKIDNEE